MGRVYGGVVFDGTPQIRFDPLKPTLNRQRLAGEWCSVPFASTFGYFSIYIIVKPKRYGLGIYTLYTTRRL